MLPDFSKPYKAIITVLFLELIIFTLSDERFILITENT